MKRNKKTQNNSPASHPKGHDHSSEQNRLNRIRGQLVGIQKMIDEHRYCPDIITQIRAVRAALKSLEASIMEGHLRGCVTSAMKAQNSKDAEGKIRELIQLFGQMKE